MRASGWMHGERLSKTFRLVDQKRNTRTFRTREEGREMGWVRKDEAGSRGNKRGGLNIRQSDSDREWGKEDLRRDKKREVNSIYQKADREDGRERKKKKKLNEEK